MNKANRNKEAAELRQRVEDIALEKMLLSPVNIEALSPEEILRIIHNLQVHRLELEMQNEQLLGVQAELDLARERYVDLYELAPVGYCTISGQGLIVEANHKAATLLGVVKGEMVGRPLTAFILDEDQDIYYLQQKQPFKTGDSQVSELRMKRGDQTVFWARLEANITTHMSQEPVYRIILTDITEQKQAAEGVLRESESKYRTAYTLMRMLCDNVPDMIWAKDLRNRYIFANKAVCRNLLNAVDTDEPIGKREMFFTERERTRHDENPRWHTFGEICRDTDGITLNAGTPQQFDEYGNVQGEFLFLDVHKAPFLDENGMMIGTVGSARDVTTTKKLEQKLKKSEARLRTLVQVIPDMIWLKDPDGVYLDCNRMFERFFGAPLKKIFGKTDYDFVDKELADFFRENDRKALAAGIPCSNEEWLTFADDGHSALFDTVKTPMFDVDGTLLGVLGIAHDITERKKTEEALQASLAEKEVLLREVHHRVKNNLAAIIGLFNLQREAMTEPQVQTVLAELSSRVRAMSLVHEKLYRSKSLARIDFQDYLQSLVSHLRTSFGAPGIVCEIEAVGVEIPIDLAIPCGMIINELITNALKYAFPNERPEVADKVSRILISMSHENDSFSLSVADNGVGMPSGFDLPAAKTLGLMLVRMLGEHQLGGRYEVDHIGGTRFVLTFSLVNGRKARA